jgi:hypothetical protein
MVVRRIDASLLEKEPQVLHLKLQAAGKLASRVFSVSANCDGTPQSRDERPPFAGGTPFKLRM